MAEVRSVVCDLCGGANASTYGITVPGKPKVRVDLCVSCAEPFEKAVAAGRVPAPQKRTKFKKVPVKPL